MLESCIFTNVFLILGMKLKIEMLMKLCHLCSCENIQVNMVFIVNKVTEQGCEKFCKTN
jgi:hypothetical protein